MTMHNYRLSPSVSYHALAKIAQLIGRLNVSGIERQIFSSLVLDAQFDFDSRIGVASFALGGTAAHNADYYVFVDIQGDYSGVDLYPQFNAAGLGSVVHFPPQSVLDVGEEANDWYWDNSKGLTPGLQILTRHAMSWTTLDPSSWETGNPDLPGVLEALWELVVTFVSNYSYSWSARLMRMAHHGMSPRTFSAWQRIREEFESLWLEFRKYMLSYVVESYDRSPIMAVVPNLSR